tara:strand:+ start:1109 stop:1309 length:201 start_codon:yes stop_codon:yes gene_type:complete
MSKVQKLYENAKKIAYKNKVATWDIFKPLLIENGYMKKNGVAIKAWGVMTDLGEDFYEIPKKKYLK